MKKKLHRKEGEQESNAVLDCSRSFNTRRWVFQLGDIIIECDDWPRKVEWGIDCVGNVVAEVVVFGICGDCYTVSFGGIGGVQLLLLMGISNEQL